VNPLLEMFDVVKSYGAGEGEVRALTDVSIAVSPGELVAVRGPSGCGKSSLLHLAGGLEDPSAGRVLVNGRDVNTMSITEPAALPLVAGLVTAAAGALALRARPVRISTMAFD
jgi:putative ABC transport system ATP-binding protein